MRILSDMKSYSRFAWGFRDFLEDPLSLDDAKAMLQQGLRERETNFLNLVERNCGCPLKEFGFHQHLHTIRSFDKLTSEGMQFPASDLLSLVEEILPDHFGGHPTDYQFVEDQIDGLPKVSILISPNVGQVNASEVVDIVIKHLGAHKGGYEMMADCWRQGHTLQVVRSEPHHTFTGKILPLHISKKK